MGNSPYTSFSGYLGPKSPNQTEVTKFGSVCLEDNFTQPNLFIQIVHYLIFNLIPSGCGVLGVNMSVF